MENKTTEFYKRTSKLNKIDKMEDVHKFFKLIPYKILFEMFSYSYYLTREFENNGRSSENFQTEAYELALWFLRQDFHQYQCNDGKNDINKIFDQRE